MFHVIALRNNETQAVTLQVTNAEPQPFTDTQSTRTILGHLPERPTRHDLGIFFKDLPLALDAIFGSKDHSCAWPQIALDAFTEEATAGSVLVYVHGKIVEINKMVSRPVLRGHLLPLQQ